MDNFKLGDICVAHVAADGALDLHQDTIDGETALALAAWIQRVFGTRDDVPSAAEQLVDMHSRISALYEDREHGGILHGTAEHRQWLTEYLRAHFCPTQIGCSGCPECQDS